MTGYEAWSTTPASNANVEGTSATNIAENNLPATINNALREVLANVAILRDNIGGAKVSAGTANAQTLDTDLPWTAYQQGILIAFEAGATLTNTGAMTMNIDSIGAKDVKVPDGAGGLTDPAAGAVSAGGIYLLAYEATADDFILINPSPGAEGQIVFPATQNASANANTLDDYEEGTFTPALEFGGGSTGLTYGTQTGDYTKIGRSVSFILNIVLTAKGSSTGNALITGLPFTSDSGIETPIVIEVDDVTAGVGNYHLQGEVNESATTIQPRDIGSGSGNWDALTHVDFTDTTVFRVFGTYNV